MHIINTAKTVNPKSEILNPKQYQNPNVQNSKQSSFRTFEFRIWDLFRISSLEFRILIVACLAFLLTGCTQKSEMERVQKYARQSEASYQRALKIQRDLIAKGAEQGNLRFELGKLYYEHGEFEKATEALENIDTLPARKLLAISYYRIGNFTDAMEVFNKNEIPDDEYLYYQGLTCEKLNLFDKALDTYKKIKAKEFTSFALGRANIIERQVNLRDISELDPKVAEMIKGAPKAEDYPQAGALVLYCDEKIEVTPQNSLVSSLYYLVKILNERGKEGFSESHIDYDSTYEKVELEYARTIRPDGKVVEVGSRHIRDVSKYLNFPLYSNARVYIISFPEIAEGSVIEYKVKIYRNQLINKKDFAFSYPVQASEPIIRADFRLFLPENKTLHLKDLNEKYNNFTAELKPRIEKQNGSLIYSWQFNNIPQILPEPSMPPNIEINPTILVSTFQPWEDIYSWWWRLAKDKIKADAPIKDKVRELISGAESLEAKARAVYNFCAKEIRYVAVEYGQAGYEPHKAEDIFRNKYGDCKDQAILLVTMLTEAGIKAWPVLIPTKEYYNLDPGFPAMLFNHAIAAVALDGETVFLDPTAETCSFRDLPAMDQGRSVLVIKEDKCQIQDIPFYPAQHNLTRQYLKIEVQGNESIAAQKSIFTYGIYDQAQRYWLLHTPPELIAEALKEKIQEVSIGAELRQYQIKNLEDLNTPVSLDYAFSGPEYFTLAGNLRIAPGFASLDTSFVAKAVRKYPLDFGVMDSKESILEITIPDNFTLKYMPENIASDSPWLSFNLEYIRKANKIYVKQSTELKKNRITESEYRDFKKFLEVLAKKVKQRIILELRK